MNHLSHDVPCLKNEEGQPSFKESNPSIQAHRRARHRRRCVWVSQVAMTLNALLAALASLQTSGNHTALLQDSASGLPFEPVCDIAHDDDCSRDDDRRSGDDTGSNNQRDTALVLTAVDCRHLPAFQSHVVDHQPAVGVVDLRRPRHKYAALEHCAQSDDEQTGEAKHRH